MCGGSETAGAAESSDVGFGDASEEMGCVIAESSDGGGVCNLSDQAVSCGSAGDLPIGPKTHIL
jgi:hypothetical protein